MHIGLRTLLTWIGAGKPTGVNPYESPKLPPKPRSVGYCSFCGKNYRDVGPLAEGPDDVYICRNCVLQCGQLIEDELKRLRKT